MGFEDDMIVIVSRGLAFPDVPRLINKLITVETIVLIHVPFSFFFFYDEMDVRFERRIDSWKFKSSLYTK